MPGESKRSRLLLLLLILELAVAVVLGALGRVDPLQADAKMRSNRQLVSHLQITDLALWSSASYCRHLSQADRFAHRSQHPGAMDPLPAGSLTGPPATWPSSEAR